MLKELNELYNDCITMRKNYWFKRYYNAANEQDTTKAAAIINNLFKENIK